MPILHEIDVRRLEGNPFKLIGDDWMLITGDNGEACNTMTASWGGLGVLWGKYVATIYVRPQRYTREFIEQSGKFSLSLFGSGFRDALTLCGSKSGRDMDKIAASGLTVIRKDGYAWFEEAEGVLLCQVVYKHDLDPDHFITAVGHAPYPDRDYHRMYIGTIEKCLVKG